MVADRNGTPARAKRRPRRGAATDSDTRRVGPARNVADCAGSTCQGTPSRSGGEMTAYYNENDPFAAQWLRNLVAAGHIAKGEVDDRSILEVQADDLRGFVQCHFFAGIGVW